ncbi:dihydrolipoamide acetyltransferase family protein [Shinella sp. DD12]|uniref:dihydrolipoamide acetyltransferase family protein n=1 Tax=Shinella sp. DD12 TaxID=1410620 RepID=UPI0003C54BDB|nr:2-oxo acid dehydrogenase subunit E2 [Shinella sp. DD12]EYR79354.1 dihydrolipoyllysine-residue succinyltransferase component of 2-oxoglutarate dehydrogenase complex [Shinella sp. DD12]MCA0341948.1 2-oxo acid dehydrogenase subunit E2 [Pseudomonadota bacterium]
MAGLMIDVLAPVEQEGTKAVVRNWLKAVGDRVAPDDPLVELETDKVTQEIPAPVAGILSEILMQGGEKAEPGAVLGRIRLEEAATAEPVAMATKQELRRVPAAAEHYSPAVRRAAEEYGIDPATVERSGKGGRVTRADMDAAHEAARAVQSSPAPVQETVPEMPPLGGRSRAIRHSPMRLAIAEHMQMSVSTAPHVTAVFEADFSAVMRHREKSRQAFAASGVSLSYTAYIVSACVAATKAVPEVNSRWFDDRLEVFDDVNIGIGTALGNEGLVVPVIRAAQDLSLSGIAAHLQDLTTRARTKTLTPADMRGGTFTISNHGVSGSLLATPIIINQPQTAILGVGKLEKRVVVREVEGVDTIQIRPMAYVSLTIDHRALDGHQTNTWLARFVETLESWPQ